MFNFLNNTKNKIRDWSLKHVERKSAKFWLALLSFSEAVFFPVPPDVLLIAILLANKAKKWAYFAFLTTLFSVLGGAFGYLLGLFFFDILGEKIISFYSLQTEFANLKSLFEKANFWAVFAAAFTPVPYKIFTLTAGFFSVNFLTFLLASAFGRAARFFAVAFILKLFGQKIADILYKYFNLFSILVLILIITLILKMI